MAYTSEPARFIPSGMIPTHEQQAIQLSHHPVTLVEANAGAAKTTTLALRIGEALARGMPPERILGLVFTSEARDVLAARLVEIGVAGHLAARVQVLTVDAFAQQVLAGMEDSRPALLATQSALKPHVLDAIEEVSACYAAKADQLDIRTHNVAISQFLAMQLRLKATLALNPEEADMPLAFVAEDLGVTLTDYLTLIEYEKLRHDAVDEAVFRGPLDATYDLALRLREVPGTAEALPTYGLVAGDELHDLNEASFAILAALLSADGTYFVGAGDKDQVIHSHLGADPQFLAHRFADRFPGTARLPLTVTYRHGPHLAYAMEAFKHKPVESTLPLHTGIAGLTYDDAQGCADGVVAALRRWADEKRAMDDCAILLRERHQSVDIENALMQARIPYRTAGMPSYLRREEILFLRGLMALALRNLETVRAKPVVHAIVEALALFGEVPMTPRDLELAKADIARGSATLHDFLTGQIQRVGGQGAHLRIASAVACLDGMEPETPAHLALEEVSRRLDMEALARRLYVDPYDASVIARSVEGFIGMARRTGLSLRGFSEWLGAADGMVDGRRSKQQVLIDCVAHAKGKEYGHVILPFLEADEFPSRLKPAAEEENLFYVGATRARIRLTLVAPADPARRSPYLPRLALDATRARADAAVQRNTELRMRQPAGSRAPAAASRPASRPAAQTVQDLNVRYADKDEAKALGAAWDPGRKVWYVPEGLDPAPFARWLPRKADA